MSTRPLVFLDTETTGLHPERRAWEVGAVRREVDGTEDTLQLFVDVHLSDADPHALRLGRFYERHPRYADHAPVGAVHESEAARVVERFTRDAVLVGNNPAFDAATLAPMLREWGLCPAWHYQLIDVVPLAAGHLPRTRRPAPPWKSWEVGELVGVPAPSAADAHTALGDARWVRAVYDTVMGGARA